MSLIQKSVLFVFFASLFISCEDKEDNVYLNITPDELIQVDNDGGAVTASVSTNVDNLIWEIEDGDWISVEKTGSELKFEVSPNEGEERHALFMIGSIKYPKVNKTISIIQSSTYLEMSTDMISLSGDKSDVVVKIKTSIDDWIYTIENGSWMDVVKNEEGLLLKVNANNTPRTREAILYITSEKFPLYDKEIKIEQLSGIVLEVESDYVALPSGGGEAFVGVNTNIDAWDYSYEGDWLTVEKTNEGVKLSARPNESSENNLTELTIYSVEYPDDIWQTVIVEQYSGLIFFDNFDWLGEGAFKPIYTGTNEKRFDAWGTAYGTYNGWTSTITADEGTGLTQWVYSRLGYAKFGKTRVNGDLITPKLEAIDGTQDIIVSFGACVYVSAGGTIDGQILNVEVIGPGTITEILKVGSQAVPEKGAELLSSVQESSGELTAGGALFILGNLANTDGPSRALWFGENYDFLAPEIAQRSFVVTGATSETQIRFLAGPNLGVSEDGKSHRHGFDDVRIELKR
ncbi:BACON domain-containing protein [Proteiniphilum sp. UBA5384]|uniref:BACON domain-containing protein n=1 Tax=Proteiniphilum sp. UBA5384 TaxID=1947279 RepID=UPI0025E825AF|nr:BACON domain-containing carbohydrate-binding protein [Proteiniphilum sp. UBA5384]